ncbi:hypothetical protein ACFQ8S_00320 [Streptomyces virginiae]|uniref:hypothetical protein n=1 Tax=Streptomyces virginiae TaxID=1961 RepID=UPI0036CBF8AF
MSVRCGLAKVAPAALAATFATSLVGAALYALLAPTPPGSLSHDWALGICREAGGLIG